MGYDFTEILRRLSWSPFRKTFIDDTVLFGFFTATLIYVSLSLLLNEAVIQLHSQRPRTAGQRNIRPRFTCPWWKFADQLLQKRSLWQILTDGQKQLEYTKQTVFKAVFNNINSWKMSFAAQLCILWALTYALWGQNTAEWFTGTEKAFRQIQL